MNGRITARWAPLLFLALASATLVSTPARAQYVQHNLASDLPGLAANTDPQLKNSWGMSFTPTSPFWISDAGTGVVTLYNGAGAKLALVVTIPGPTATIPSEPTGQVFNNAGTFALSNGGNATFLFASTTGTISGWNPAAGTNAITQVNGFPGSSYTGLAIAGTGAGARLYAANFGTGVVDVFNGSFAPVPGGFIDPTLPAGYAPFNVQNVGGNIVVTYALKDPTTGDDLAGAGHGFVDVYDPSGALLRRVATDAVLNSPWGVTLAPAGFGPFGGALLVGNFGDGTIHAYDFFTGALLGGLTDANGAPIVNDGLWALAFRTGGPSVDPNALYLTAGIQDEAHGLFASLTAAPEPGTLGLFATGLVALLAAGVRRRRTPG
jgi:PEP-CTERM putative exosortase interaction domain/TIGR03118 family protein